MATVVLPRKSAMESARPINVTAQLERVPLRSKQLDDRRRKIRDYDEKCKQMIEEHLQTQKKSHKLGLDYHIFEDDNPRGPL